MERLEVVSHSVRSPDGVRLAVREWPARRPSPAVLLLHGLASSSHIFDLVAPLLAPAFRVVAYDQRGHGESGKPGARYGFAHTAGDAGAVIDALRLVRPIVLGHSWGANVALEVAVRHPRTVGGAMLLDGGFLPMRARMDWPTARTLLAPPPLRGLHVERFLSMLRERFAGVVPITTEVEAVFLSLMRVDATGAIRPRLSRQNHLRILWAMWQQDVAGLLAAARVPILVVATRQRAPSPEERPFLESKREAARTVRGLAGVRFEWIEGIHDVPLQRPGAVAARIRRFAREAAGATARPAPGSARGG